MLGYFAFLLFPFWLYIYYYWGYIRNGQGVSLRLTLKDGVKSVLRSIFSAIFRLYTSGRIPETKAKIICLGASNQVFRRKWYRFGPTRSMNICSTFVQIHREIATWVPTQNRRYNSTFMIRVRILSFHPLKLSRTLYFH